VFLFEVAANKVNGSVFVQMSSSSSSAGIQGSLEEIDKSLKDVQDRREKLIKGTRDVVMLCSKSIVAMHHSQLEDAKSKMDQAKAMLEEFRKYAGHDLYR
jgi:translin